MSDMTPTIIAKSDQLNAADLAGGPITVTVTKVDIRDAKEQPVSVHYQGDNGKPWKPCKSMCRVMVAAWGPDSKTYPGKSLTLFCDPSVKWAGMEIGGIRISHMSDIDGPLLTAVTLAKGSRKPYRVEPLAGGQGDDGAADMAADLIRRAEALRGDAAGLAELAAKEGIIKRRAWLLDASPALSAKVDAAFIAITPADTATPDNPTAAEGPAEDDRGEAHVEDETPAWRPVVDAHLGRLTKLETLIDVKGAINQFAETKRALPDDAIADVDAAETNAQMRFSTVTGG